MQRFSGGGPFETRIGYSRAVKAGGFVFVAGTVGQGDAVEDQCRDALRIISEVLSKAGSGLDRAVRVTYYLPKRDEFERCWPILSDAFGANPPAATMVEAGLIDPKYRIEIEVTALA